MTDNCDINFPSYEEWERVNRKIVGSFEKFFLNESFSDVTFIIVDEKKIVRGHKFVLSTCSWEFYKAFNHLKLDTCEFTIPDVYEEAFKKFLEFCYKGKVDLACMSPWMASFFGGVAWDVLKLAYRFNIGELIGICEKFILNELVLDRSEGFLFFLKDTFLPKDSFLKKKILLKIQDFLYEYARGIVIDSCELTHLREIAKMEALKFDEMLLFDALISWAKQRCEEDKISPHPANLRRVLGDVFYEIRFPTMRMEWIFEIQAKYPGILTHREYSDIAKFIRKDEDSCPGFKYKFREVGYAYIDPMNISYETIYRIQCFEGSPKRTNISSSELSIRFKCETPRKFIGFGIFVKRSICLTGLTSAASTKYYFHELDKSTSMNFPKYGNFYVKVDVCWEYSYVHLLLRDQTIIPGRWYVLHVQYPGSLTLQTRLKSFDDEAKIHFQRDGNHKAVPYLLFAKE